MQNDAEFTPSIKSRIRGLDELRGLAILSVLIGHFFGLRTLHSALSYFEIGALGVDLFFIISGFLITKILLATKENPFYFRTFYVRRVFRILPLFVLVLVIGVAIAIIFKKPLISLPLYLTFMQNLIPEHPNIGSLIPESFVALPGLGQLWSLAVEEHVYILLPMIVATTQTRYLRHILIGIAIVGISCKLYVTTPILEEQSWLTYMNPRETWFRMQYIAMGALLAVPGGTRGLLFVIVFWLSAVLYFQHSMLEFLLGLVMLAAVVLSTVDRPLIQNQFLRVLGVQCYGIYLLHLFILLPFKMTNWNVWYMFPVYLLVCILVSTVSFHLFEMPIQRLRTQFERKQEGAQSHA